MIILGEISTGTGEPEKLVTMLAIVGLLILAGWQFFKRLLQSQPAPDPWDESINAELAKADAIPLCHRCLTPHSHDTDFCPACGTPVGQYTNWLPFPQLFSIGHVLRTGTNGDFKRTPLTILGFMLFSLAEYMLFVPIYWIVFLRKIFGHPPVETPPEQSPPAQQATTR